MNSSSNWSTTSEHVLVALPEAVEKRHRFIRFLEPQQGLDGLGVAREGGGQRLGQGLEGPAARGSRAPPSSSAAASGADPRAGTSSCPLRSGR